MYRTPKSCRPYAGRASHACLRIKEVSGFSRGSVAFSILAGPKVLLAEHWLSYYVNFRCLMQVVYSAEVQGTRHRRLLSLAGPAAAQGAPSDDLKEIDGQLKFPGCHA